MGALHHQLRSAFLSHRAPIAETPSHHETESRGRLLPRVGTHPTVSDRARTSVCQVRFTSASIKKKDSAFAHITDHHVKATGERASSLLFGKGGKFGKGCIYTDRKRAQKRQEGIPVGYVLPAYWPLPNPPPGCRPSPRLDADSPGCRPSLNATPPCRPSWSCDL